MELKVSAVIAVRNEAETIGACLESILNQSFKPCEVIVVNDGSEDATEDIVSSFPVKLINIKHERYSFSIPRKKGVDVAKGDIIFIGDGNAIYSQNYLEETVKHFDNPKIGGVASRMHIGNPNTWINKSRYAVYESRSEKEVEDRVNNGVSAAWVYRKKAYDEVRGYDTDLEIDDLSITQKMRKKGYTIVYEQNADWYHDFEDNLYSLIKKTMKMGSCMVTLYGKYPSFFSFKKYVYTFILPFLIIPLGFIYPIIILLYIFPYILKMSDYYLKARRRRVDYKKYLIAYPILTFISNFFFYLGYTVQKLRSDKKKPAN